MADRKNKDVRQAIKQSGFTYWQVAMELGIADGTFSRKLRVELPPEKKAEVFAAIDRLGREA